VHFKKLFEENSVENPDSNNFNVFKLIKSRKVMRRESLAGLTTFLTMSYIVFVNPSILSVAGMDHGAVFVVTCLVSALACFLMGWLSNYPIAVAPGMALNVYFTYVIVRGLGFAWQDALGAVFIAGILFLLISLTRLRRYIITAIPSALNMAITTGLGLFIALIALHSIGVSIPGVTAGVRPAHFGLEILLFFAGLITIAACSYYKIPGAILAGIFVTTILGLVFGLAHFHGVFSLPPSIKPTFLHLRFDHLLSLKGISVVFAFLFVTLFDCTGTLIGLLNEAKLLKNKNSEKRIARGLLADSIATVAGSLMGTSSLSPYLESATGISIGGRTGMTAFIVGGLFLFALFLSPLAATIPSFATAPALLFVGCLMIRSITYINWRDVTDLIPSLVTLIVIPYTLSIANGVGAGILSYTLLKIICRKRHQVNATLVILSVLFLFYFVLQASL